MRSLCFRGGNALVSAAFVFVASVLPAAPVAAQDESDFAAALAIFLTPTGNITSVSPAALGLGASRSAAVNYGYRDDVHTAGLTGDIGIVRLQGGALFVEDADPAYMIGAGVGGTFLNLATSPTAALTIGGEGSVGYGWWKDAGETLTSLTLGVKAPVAITLGSATRVTPYLAPGFFFGRIGVEGENESGTRFTLNGGVRIATAGGIGVEAGVHRVFIEEADTTFGLGLSYQWR